jgi:predicted O-methyltransferase YrrM
MDQSTISGLKTTLKQLLGKERAAKLRQAYDRWRHAAGTYTWATKSYEVWLVLQTELYLVRPRSLVEFGSGRSTSYLAEYAYKMGAQLTSIEEHAHYTKKANRLLRDSFLPDKYVHHVPVHNGWYDETKVSRLLQSLDSPIDFILIDGPSEVGTGDRASRCFKKCVVPLLDSVKIAVVDDVHRPECEVTAQELVDSFGLTRYDMRYGKRNAIAFLHSREAEAALAQLPNFLKALFVPTGLPRDVAPQPS